MPAHQRLHPGDFAAVGAELGLEIRQYLAILDRTSKGRPKGVAVCAGPGEICRIGPDRAGPVQHCLFHGDLCCVKQAASTGTVSLAGVTKTDATCQLD